ncbi:MAG: hypothetical protein Q4G35_13855, partial [Propionibacteriaceae bacterium]|nr:hypothetical protein [Propionibacteriaceae bacterium]
MISMPRRRLLALAGGIALGVTGCQASNPVIRGGPTAPPALEPAPTEPAVPAQENSLVHEVTLATLAGTAHDDAAARQIDAQTTAVLGWLAAGHDVHVTALLDARPARRSTTAPTPAPGRTPRTRPAPTDTLVAGPAPEVIRQLHDLLEAALVDYRTAAIGGQGTSALLWGSLAAYARSAQAALARSAPRPEPPAIAVRELEPWSDAEAEQQALRQVHALIYGYQVAIGQLVREEERAAYAALVQRRALRDHLAAALRERG